MLWVVVFKLELSLEMVSLFRCILWWYLVWINFVWWVNLFVGKVVVFGYFGFFKINVIWRIFLIWSDIIFLRNVIWSMEILFFVILLFERFLIFVWMKVWVLSLSSNVFILIWCIFFDLSWIENWVVFLRFMRNLKGLIFGMNWWKFF